jgi:hypothetical protein
MISGSRAMPGGGIPAAMGDGTALLGLPIGLPKISNASARLSATPGEIVRVEPFVDCCVIARVSSKPVFE